MFRATPKERRLADVYHHALVINDPGDAFPTANLFVLLRASSCLRRSEIAPLVTMRTASFTPPDKTRDWSLVECLEYTNNLRNLLNAVLAGGGDEEAKKVARAVLCTCRKQTVYFYDEFIRALLHSASQLQKRAVHVPCDQTSTSEPNSGSIALADFARVLVGEAAEVHLRYHGARNRGCYSARFLEATKGIALAYATELRFVTRFRTENAQDMAKGMRNALDLHEYLKSDPSLMDDHAYKEWYFRVCLWGAFAAPERASQMMKSAQQHARPPKDHPLLAFQHFIEKAPVFLGEAARADTSGAIVCAWESARALGIGHGTAFSRENLGGFARSFLDLRTAARARVENDPRFQPYAAKCTANDKKLEEELTTCRGGELLWSALELYGPILRDGVPQTGGN